MPKLVSTTRSRDKESLAVEVRTSLKIIHRGKKFNVHVSLQNPFDTPVTLLGWSWQLPPGLVFVGESPGNRDISELQPGDSCSLVFTIKAAGVLNFTVERSGRFGLRLTRETPAQIGENVVSINIAYGRGGLHHWQEVQAALNLYASPLEIYLGAVIGAIAGSFVRKPALGFELLLSAVLGFFLVLIAKRRSDVQLGISIEDWVGGAIVGFSLGYLGTSYFENFLPTM